METWKILLLTVLIAVALGCVAGILIGKYAVKRANSSRKPLLSFRERIVYSALILVGAGLIAFANLYTFPATDAQLNASEEEQMPEGDMGDGEQVQGGTAGGEVVVHGGGGGVVIMG